MLRQNTNNNPFYISKVSANAKILDLESVFDFTLK